MRECSRKTFALLTSPKPSTVWITINLENSEGDGNTRPPDLPLEKPVRKQQLELDMEQQTGSKQEKESVEAVNCHPAYLTYMQSTS